MCMCCRKKHLISQKKLSEIRGRLNLQVFLKIERIWGMLFGNHVINQEWVMETYRTCICICSSKLHLSLRSILAVGALSSYMKARLELDHVISDLICTD